MKAIERDDPVITSSSAHGAFTPGRVSAEAHLFTLDATRRYLGGFRFHATNSDSVRVQATNEKVYETAKKIVFGDLGTQTRNAFVEGVKHFGKGSLTVEP